MFKVHHNNEVLVSHLEIEVKKRKPKICEMKTTKANITKLKPKNVQQAYKLQTDGKTAYVRYTGMVHGYIITKLSNLADGYGEKELRVILLDE